MAYLQSPVFLREYGGGHEVQALHEKMFEAMHTEYPEIVFETAEQILKRLY